MKDLFEIECFLLDMDGTFYLGEELIDGALEFVKKINESGKQFIFLTNNSSKSSKDYQDKLERLGVSVPLKSIINSGQVTADYIRQQKERAIVYVVGTPSLEAEIKEAELQIATSKEVDVDYLVLGFDTTLNYQKLWDAHDLIVKGVTYLASNPDYVCPLAGGKTMPDCGAMINLFKTSTGREPLVIGKPNTLMIDYVVERRGMAKDKLAMVGDRLYTDIQTAHNAGITSILVLSGETSFEELGQSPQKPDYVFKSIKELAGML